MNSQQLLLKLPVPLQNAAISLYGLRVRRDRYGGEFAGQLAELRTHDAWTQDRIERYQNEELRRVLEWARWSTPYYKSRLASRPDFSGVTVRDLPRIVEVLEKNFVRSQPQDFHADLGDEEVTTIFTSGTSGTPLVIKVDRPALKKNYAYYARTLSWFGLKPLDRHATFAGRVFIPEKQSGGPYWRSNYFMNQKLFSSYHLSDETLPQYLDALERWQPDYIDSYPSAIHQVALHKNRSSRQWRIRPRAVLVSSETLLENQRQEIETAFGCPVIDQYGNAEMAAWINQCEKGSLHVNSDYGILELLDGDGKPVKPGETGEMVCTGFINRAMPLIRYKIGDSAILSERHCACGRPFPVIEQVVGRTDGMVVTPSGKYIGRMDPVFKGVENIAASQIIQIREDTLLVKVIPASGFKDDDRQKLTEQIQARVGADMNVEIAIVEDIPKTKAGKFQSVVSLAQYEASSG